MNDLIEQLTLRNGFTTDLSTPRDSSLIVNLVSTYGLDKATGRFPTPVLVKNRKNGNLYLMLGIGVDCTNERDGARLVHYVPCWNYRAIPYCRDEKEFWNKFDLVSNSDSLVEEMLLAMDKNAKSLSLKKNYNDYQVESWYPDFRTSTYSLSKEQYELYIKRLLRLSNLENNKDSSYVFGSFVLTRGTKAVRFTVTVIQNEDVPLAQVELEELSI